MRSVKQCKESTSRMRKHRCSDEFKVTAVKMVNAPDIETRAVAKMLAIHPLMLSREKKEYREGKLKGRGRNPGRREAGIETTGTQGVVRESGCVS